MLEQYGKESHREAMQSASALKEGFSALRETNSLKTKTFQASATDQKAISIHIPPGSIDIVFTDVPYGRHSQWQDSDWNAPSNPLSSMLEALLEIVSPSSVLAIASDKKQKVSHERYQRIEQFQVGKRRVVILKPT
jgi:hypothetical protein